MLSKRDFHQDPFYLWALQQYEAARVYLKNCGRPASDQDRHLIAEAKWGCSFFKRLLD